MALCHFATWKPFTGPSGPYTGGPFKIVHHTTEGSTAAGAFAAYQANHSDPHFTVDATTIYQHIDTGVAARALRNDTTKPLQTNRDGAVQIEVVGFAHLPKNSATLRNVARLCRWIEATHTVPQIWPNGVPKPAINGHDPGGHNRNPINWDTKGGHYGHCHVPENTHWDPGYTSAEVTAIMQLQFAPSGDVARDEGIAALTAPEADAAEALADAKTTMPDHHGAPAAPVDEAPLAAPEDDTVAEGVIEIRLASGHVLRIGKSGSLDMLRNVLKELSG